MAQKIFIGLLVVFSAAISAIFVANLSSQTRLTQAPSKNCITLAHVCSKNGICGTQKIRVC